MRRQGLGPASLAALPEGLRLATEIGVSSKIVPADVIADQPERRYVKRQKEAAILRPFSRRSIQYVQASPGIRAAGIRQTEVRNQRSGVTIDARVFGSRC